MELLKPKDLAARVGAPLGKIYRLLKERKLAHHRESPRGPMTIALADWEAYVRRTRIEAEPVRRVRGGSESCGDKPGADHFLH